MSDYGSCGFPGAPAHSAVTFNNGHVVKPGTVAVKGAEQAGQRFLADEQAGETLLAIVAEKLDSALRANADPKMRTWQALWARYDGDGNRRLDVKAGRRGRARAAAELTRARARRSSARCCATRTTPTRPGSRSRRRR